jgi:hypothetical protein
MTGPQILVEEWWELSGCQRSPFGLRYGPAGAGTAL